MNIIEAVRSGKPFKRKDWSDKSWQTADNNSFITEEVLADDWEIKPDKPPRPEVPEKIGSPGFAIDLKHSFYNIKINKLIDCVAYLIEKDKEE